MEFLLLRLAVSVFPLILTVRTVKVGLFKFLVADLDVKFSLVTFHITNHHHGWGVERVKGVKITEEGAAVQPLAREPRGVVAPHGWSMLDAAHYRWLHLLFTSHQFEVVHLL